LSINGQEDRAEMSCSPHALPVGVGEAPIWRTPTLPTSEVDVPLMKEETYD
jgi:hypothetical protein